MGFDWFGTYLSVIIADYLATPFSPVVATTQDCMFTDRQKRLCLRVVAAAVLVFMALIIVFGVSESNFRWGF